MPPPSRGTAALRDADTSPRCNVRTRCKILGLRPFPAPSAAHLPAPHYGPLSPCRALFARADGFTSASTVFSVCVYVSTRPGRCQALFVIYCFILKKHPIAGGLAGGSCISKIRAARAALLFLTKYKMIYLLENNTVHKLICKGRGYCVEE